METPISIHDVFKPESTNERSERFTSLHWKQAYTEAWTTSPITNHNPSSAMLEDGGEVIFKQVYMKRFDPLHRDRRKSDSYLCQVQFDRSYVIWWFVRLLKPLVEFDELLLDSIATECGVVVEQPEVEIVSGIEDVKQLRAIAKQLGYRLVKAHEK